MEPPYSPSAQIGQLFHACDLDGSGFIDETELASICPNLSHDEVKDVFRELDKDGDGHITMVEFSEGFKGILDRQAGKERGTSTSTPLRQGGRAEEHRDQGIEDEEADTPDFVENLDEGFLALNCQEQVCELYQTLHSADLPQVLAQFENVILSVIKDIRQQQYENERLERSYKREKDQHSRHLRQLEEEMEAQVSRVETRVRKEEREKAEHEKDELRQQLQTEINELTSNLKRLQKLEDQLKREPSEKLKSQLSDLTYESRHLRASLTEAQTNLALLKSELTTVRQQYEDKCAELESEKETMFEYIREQDSLTRQVLLLQDANKKLHDTNDDLRAALETSRTAFKRSHSSSGRVLSRSNSTSSRSSDFMNVSDYFNGRNPRNSLNSSLAEELGENDAVGRHLLPAQESCEVDSLPDDIDSGHSTLRDVHEIESEYEPNSLEDDVMTYTPRKRRIVAREFDSTTESELLESQDEMDTEAEGVEELDGPSRPGSVSSRPSSRASSQGSHQRQGTVRRRLPPTPMMKPITSAPERMYKVVLAGDAAVGKSSFIMRLCKGKFVNNISSTLGVDFQTKVLEVEGRVIALQLWDTAGQERFRSIAKSYFRRADGVLLLYDCTYERSFLNVREWVDAVEDGAQKKIPIMLCGNKTDLRDEYEQQGKGGVVKTDQGSRLARDVEALFCETSAKDGENVLEGVTELAKLLCANEDLEVHNAGLTLDDKTEPKKKGVTCCNS